MNKKGKAIIFYIVLIVLVLVATTSLLNSAVKEEIKYTDVLTAFKSGEVVSFEIDQNNKLTYVTKDGVKHTYTLLYFEVFYNDLHDTIEEQYEAGTLTYNYDEPTEIPWWVSILPYIIMIALFIGLWVFMMRQASGKGGKIGSFGKAKSKTPDEKHKVFFKDVAGADEEKAELEEVVDFLKDPAKYTKLGAKIPHGVLLMGPPGTGKTLLAKAVAGEAGVPFYSISGSDFVEMYVGVGASRVRDLFDTARKSKAAIIFIDEIDAVGRHRGAGLGGGHDEREQTLNQLLVEMDGFDAHDGIIVIAATNRPDILDPALLRPGRFDRQITVNYPDIEGRIAILEVHAQNKHFAPDVDFRKVAQETAGFTGADLANLLNESALLAARKNQHLITMEDIEESSIKIMVGPQKKTMKMKESEKKKTAYHEAGHAILAHVLPTQDPVRQISIIPGGRALGYTLNPPVEDKYSVYKNELKEKICMLLGGRVAEQIIFDDYSGGASNDIQRATEIARKMVTKLGMSEKLGPIVFGSEHSDDEVFLGRDFSSSRNYSENVAAEIDSEIHRIIQEAYDLAEKLLRENIEKLHFIADYLVKHEVIDDEQFRMIMEGDPSEEDLEKIAEEKKKRSKEADLKRREEVERQRAEEERRRAEQVGRVDPQNTVIFGRPPFTPDGQPPFGSGDSENSDQENGGSDTDNGEE
ncbi:MAG: ATP-dependent zinc metalloprotease FtsH [Clostridia bacterium]|nr:ATP-dependent zinc metalloprotease FtsH [Clostridia bacterium]